MRNLLILDERTRDFDRCLAVAEEGTREKERNRGRIFYFRKPYDENMKARGNGKRESESEMKTEDRVL